MRILKPELQQLLRELTALATVKAKSAFQEERNERERNILIGEASAYKNAAQMIERLIDP